MDLYSKILISDHNTFSGIQGGTTGEYYHLTSAESSAIPFAGKSGTAIAVVGAATLNTLAGKVTSESLTTIGGSSYTLTLTNSQIAATDMVFVSVANGTNTGGEPEVTLTTPASGSVTIEVSNDAALGSFNGTIIISFLVIKA